MSFKQIYSFNHKLKLTTFAKVVDVFSAFVSLLFIHQLC